MKINGTPIDCERAKTDFVFWATHYIIDGKTGKQIQWTRTQIKFLNKLVELKNNPNNQHLILLKRR